MEFIYGHRSDLSITKVDESHAKNLEKQIIFSPSRGWPGHAMRLMRLASGGASFNHKHAHPHWVYVVEGEGSITLEETVYPAPKGTYMFIPGQVQHCLQNTGEAFFEFICCIPAESDDEA